MNLFALIGPNSPQAGYVDETIGGPLQRVMNASFKLTNAIYIARSSNNTTRMERLLAFQAGWECSAQKILGYPADEPRWGLPTANTYAYTLSGEVDTALAVND